MNRDSLYKCWWEFACGNEDNIQFKLTNKVCCKGREMFHTDLDKCWDKEFKKERRAEIRRLLYLLHYHKPYGGEIASAWPLILIETPIEQTLQKPRRATYAYVSPWIKLLLKKNSFNFISIKILIVIILFIFKNV